jgi:hypothetical protein
VTKFLSFMLALGFVASPALASSKVITYGEVLFECTSAHTPDLSVDQTMFNDGNEGTILGRGVITYTGTDVYLNGQHLGTLDQTPTCPAQSAPGMIDSAVTHIIFDSGIQLELTETPDTDGCFLNDLHNGLYGQNSYTRINNYRVSLSANGTVTTGTWPNTAYYQTMEICKDPNR